MNPLPMNKQIIITLLYIGLDMQGWIMGGCWVREVR